MKKNVWLVFLISLGILLVLGGVIFGLFKFGVFGQSFLSISSVNVGTDGKVYWVAQASANSASPETFTFLPPTYSYTDGSGKTVSPIKTLSISVSKVNSKCEYTTTTQTFCGLLCLTHYTYYTLNNPQKVAQVNFTDGNGQTKMVDGTVVQDFSIPDTDGNGSVRIQTQGLLSGKFNCPNYENVVIYNGQFIYKDLFKAGAGASVSNTQFTNTFSNVSFNQNTGVVDGGINLGNVVYTITADQDYFNSVIYTPPTTSEPKITAINIPNQITQNALSSMTIDIRNNVANSGNIIITPTSSILTFTPTIDNENLPASGSIRVSFNVRAVNSVQNGAVTVKACSSSQFTNDVKCDTYTKTISIVSSSVSVNEQCGDGVCQASETQATCPQDCSTNNPPPVCKWYQTSYTKQTALFGLIPGSQGCTLATRFVIAIVIGVIILIVLIIIGIKIGIKKLTQ